MKNIKNILTAITLAAILMLGTSTAKAGLVLSDATGDTEKQCTENATDSFSISGIILLGVAAAKDGIILLGFDTAQDTTSGGDCSPADSNESNGLILTD